MEMKTPCGRGRPRRSKPDDRTPAQRRIDRLEKRRVKGARVISHLDALPDTARIGTDGILAALAISTTTLWRRIRDGKLPTMNEDGGKRYWTAGQLRAVLGGGN